MPIELFDGHFFCDAPTSFILGMCRIQELFYMSALLFFVFRKNQVIYAIQYINHLISK